ncbi:MAG: DUF4091 domain-containing protein [Kiritimatiellia bacterium]
MKKLLAGVVMGGCLVASALELAAWRGETVSAWLPAGERVGAAPAGFVVKTGVARDVKYAPTPKAVERLTMADRVEWNAKAEGPRVVQIQVPAEAKPGRYAIGDVTVRVVDQVLPPAREWKYYLDLWQHPWAVARVAGVEPFSKEHYAAMEPIWRLLATAGQKTLTVTLVDLPWNHQCQDGYGAMVKYTRRADGTTAFDWTLFDAYVAFGRRCGLGPHIACYTMCPWGYLVSWYDEAGKMQKGKAVPGEPFFEDYWGPFLKAFAAHLKEKGWFEDVLVSLDERSPEDLRNTVAFLRKMAPGMKIAMAGNRKPSEFKGIEMASYSQALGYVNPGFLAEVPQRQKEGKITTYYICCGPARPNTFMDSELDEAFWCGAYPAMCGLDGLLRWAWNSWPVDACADASYGNWRAGDTFLVYPDGSPSMRFLELLNGIQQAEKFNILKARGVRTAELDALAAKYDLKAALNKKPGDFKALVKLTKETLNK